MPRLQRREPAVPRTLRRRVSDSQAATGIWFLLEVAFYAVALLAGC